MISQLRTEVHYKNEQLNTVIDHKSTLNKYANELKNNETNRYKQE